MISNRQRTRHSDSPRYFEPSVALQKDEVQEGGLACKTTRRKEASQVKQAAHKPFGLATVLEPSVDLQGTVLEQDGIFINERQRTSRLHSPQYSEPSVAVQESESQEGMTALGFTCRRARRSDLRYYDPSARLQGEAAGRERIAGGASHLRCMTITSFTQKRPSPTPCHTSRSLLSHQPLTLSR